MNVAHTAASLNTLDPRVAQQQAQAQANPVHLQKIATPSKDGVATASAPSHAAANTTSASIKQVKFNDAKHELEFAKTKPPTSISQSQQRLPPKSIQVSSQNISSILKTPTTSTVHASTQSDTHRSSGRPTRINKEEEWLVRPPEPDTPTASASNIDSEMVNDSTHLSARSRATYPTFGFDWDQYLKLAPAEVAPKEAFRQTTEQIANLFSLKMKLEARDPRSDSDSWGLASVVGIYGLRIRLRFDNCDALNDFYELVDSENIRPVNSVPGQALRPPVGYTGSHLRYNSKLEKVLTLPDTKVAPSHYFLKTPKKPEKNLFKPGMKLEAVDRKNPDLICPATIGEVNGEEVKIAFDGWKGSFDYTCPYYSRDLFPVNWCRDNNHAISAPSWDAMLKGAISPPKSQPGASTATSSTNSIKITLTKSPTVKNRPVLPESKVQLSEKEIHMAKVQLQPTSSNASPKSAESKKPDYDFMFKNSTPIKMNQSTPKKDNNKRKRSPSPLLSSDTDASTDDKPFKVWNDREVDNFDTDQQVANIDEKYQCQRTKAYDWKQAKILKQQQPQQKPQQHPSQSPPQPALQQSQQPQSQQNESKHSQNLPQDSSQQISSKQQETQTAVPEVQRDTPASSSSSETSTDVYMSDISSASPVKPSSSTHQNGAQNGQEQKVKGRRGRPPKKLKTDHLESPPEQGTSSTQNQHDSFPLSPNDWSINHVIKLIKSDNSLAKYSDIFVTHEIDGKAFLLLTTDIMINHMGLKIGPVLKIKSLIDQVKLKKVDLRTL